MTSFSYRDMKSRLTVSSAQLPIVRQRLHLLQATRFLWCGSGHLYREWPENANTKSTHKCYSRTLRNRRKFHPTAKENSAKYFHKRIVCDGVFLQVHLTQAFHHSCAASKQTTPEAASAVINYTNGWEEVLSPEKQQEQQQYTKQKIGR
jgi:hypothetical protein